MFILSACNVTLIFHTEIPSDEVFYMIFFHVLLYFSSLCFYLNVQPENIILKSHSFSFDQVNTLPLNLTCYKEFLNFLFTKILNNYLSTQCISMCPQHNSHWKIVFNPAAREMDHQLWKKIKGRVIFKTTES